MDIFGHHQVKSAYEFMLKMSFNTFVEKMSEGRHLIVDNDKQEELMIKSNRNRKRKQLE